MGAAASLRDDLAKALELLDSGEAGS